MPRGLIVATLTAAAMCGQAATPLDSGVYSARSDAPAALIVSGS